MDTKASDSVAESERYGVHGETPAGRNTFVQNMSDTMVYIEQPGQAVVCTVEKFLPFSH